MAIHARRVKNDLLGAPSTSDPAPSMIAAPQIPVDHDGADALQVAVPEQPGHDDLGRGLDGLGELRVGAVLPDAVAQDRAQAVVRVEVGPRRLPGVVLGRGAAARRHGEPVQGLVETCGDGRERGVQAGQFAGQRLAGAAGRGRVEVQEVGRHEVLVLAVLERAVGVGSGTEAWHDVVYRVEGLMFACWWYMSECCMSNDRDKCNGKGSSNSYLGT